MVVTPQDIFGQGKNQTEVALQEVVQGLKD